MITAILENFYPNVPCPKEIVAIKDIINGDGGNGSKICRNLPKFAEICRRISVKKPPTGAVKTPEKIADVLYERSHIQVLILKNFYSSQDTR